MPSRLRVLARACVAAGMAAGAVGFAAAAEYVILDSNAAGVDPGLVVDAGAQINVPEGASLILITPGGETLAIEGPYSGLVSGAGAASASTLERLTTTRDRDTKVLGAVRSPKVDGGSVKER